MVRSGLLCSLALGAALLSASPARAQHSGDGFLFREPAAQLALRAGYHRASAGSDVFSFTSEHLTLDRGDFSGPSLGADLSFRITPRFDFVLGGSYTGMRAESEFRDWVDGDDQPIKQTTTFQRAPLSAGVRMYLAPRGRTIGRFAWIPARYTPYVGVDGGAMWYRFRQQGEFVDFETLDIFPDVLESSGWTPTAQGVAGLDVSLSPRIALTGEARYLWARAGLDQSSFEDFEPIDLAGYSATFGIKLRF